MSTVLRWKFILMAALITLSVVFVLPSFYKNTPDWFKNYIYSEGLKLGLDLQGGMHLILKVDVDQAVKNSADLAATDLKESLGRRQITLVRRQSPNPDEILFFLPNKDAVGRVKAVLEDEFVSLELVKVTEEGKFPSLTLRLSPKEEKFIRENSVDQSLEIIRNRIDQFGVTEPVIVRQGEEKIVVQLPGIQDPERALKLIGQTAQLEFKLVDDESGVNIGRLIRQATDSGRLPAGYNIKALNSVLKGQIPRDDSIYFLKEVDDRTGKPRKTPILLKDKTLMTGDTVKTAHVRIGGNYNEPYVALEFTDRGAGLFEKITADNVGKRLAIVLDGVARSAPVIRERIGGGHAQITGSFTPEEASDLAIVLRAGALPAPISIIQNVTVGPSLGHDSIQHGLYSGLLGAAIVLVFMVIYYTFSGFIANIAMFLNLLFLMAVLALFQATLTLPGIAGIILIIGMGVDSNVLIFERMREERALGKPLKAFIDGGYDKAFWTIVDAHVTTLITAIALFLFGTGPIKGFAVTLSAGIVINLFTAIFGTRMVYDGLLSKHALTNLRFLQLIKKTSLDFIGRRNFAFVLSVILVTIGLAGFIQIVRGAANLGVDFSGGTMVQYRADKPFTLDKVRKALTKKGVEGYSLQEVPGEHVLIVRVKKSVATVGDIETSITNSLKEGLSETSFVIESKAEIGSTVSKELRRKALIAILISFAGIICYLAFRFNLSFGVAATAATLHDVLVVLGILFILNKEITLLTITALLTLGGYSLTDTVVVFDRIRENIKRYKKLPFAEIINRSINEMLSRTIITSLTTMMVVLCIFVFGGVVIHDFAFTLLLGVLVGTYSSVFVASPVVYLWHKGKAPR
ncbi:MAG: protein translocase subunit SecD [Deltaproteobacteria bacterium]|nr:protein translocase subunit SecD [Deltaproteobacteria bacterium]MBW1718462.1 protein translocase subunit SecD [Deltaproteobacteria bacterium]MBW1931641.1 protein translocase subunit SecD [Deltaproteobacteria bacterium]MBW1937667.1 protein translocase subunit SecD [Deltaproteobacteria bacterium]MBW2079512.1 protein translocase subunit SecD [Deltaproteobacteria bacterium]